MSKIEVEIPDHILKCLEGLIRENKFDDLNEAVLTAIIHTIVHADRYGIDSVKKKVKKALELYDFFTNQNKESLERYKESGIKQWKFVATNDERTCEECRNMDGKIFDIDDVKTLPPLHFGCRCTITPIVEKK